MARGVRQAARLHAGVCVHLVQPRVPAAGAALRLRAGPRAAAGGHLRLPAGLHGLPRAPRGRPALRARLSQRPRLPRVLLHAVHAPPLGAAVHARAGRVPRAAGPRAHVRGPRLCRLFARHWARQPGRLGRGHQAARGGAWLQSAPAAARALFSPPPPPRAPPLFFFPSATGSAWSLACAWSRGSGARTARGCCPPLGS